MDEGIRSQQISEIINYQIALLIVRNVSWELILYTHFYWREENISSATFLITESQHIKVGNIKHMFQIEFTTYVLCKEK